MENDIFENLFVLEAANNHWGDVQRGKKIIQDFATVVRFNNIKAAIKFQFRDVEHFIHDDFKGNQEIRYIKKTEATQMSKSQYRELAQAVVKAGCIPMATPFDEASVDTCIELNFPIIKIASSDINDWSLIEHISYTKKPVIVSTGGASEKSIDEIVAFFEKRNISLAINHCVSLYPSEDHQLELGQISYLKNRYPGHVIGFSSHEYHDWQSSMYMSYALGARTWERHIDIDFNDIPVSPYCSLPVNIDAWFRAYHKSREMLGNSDKSRRILTPEEIHYLDALVRGIYTKKDVPEGHVIDSSNFSSFFKLAVPLLKGQLSSREVLNGTRISRALKADQALKIQDVESPYNDDSNLRKLIENRGL